MTVSPSMHARVHIHLHLLRCRTSVICFYLWLFSEANFRLYTLWIF